MSSSDSPRLLLLPSGFGSLEGIEQVLDSPCRRNLYQGEMLQFFLLIPQSMLIKTQWLPEQRDVLAADGSAPRSADELPLDVHIMLADQNDESVFEHSPIQASSIPPAGQPSRKFYFFLSSGDLILGLETIVSVRVQHLHCPVVLHVTVSLSKLKTNPLLVSSGHLSTSPSRFLIASTAAALPTLAHAPADDSLRTFLAENRQLSVRSKNIAVKLPGLQVLQPLSVTLKPLPPSCASVTTGGMFLPVCITFENMHPTATIALLHAEARALLSSQFTGVWRQDVSAGDRGWEVNLGLQALWPLILLPTEKYTSVVQIPAPSCLFSSSVNFALGASSNGRHLHQAGKDAGPALKLIASLSWNFVASAPSTTSSLLPPSCALPERPLLVPIIFSCSFPIPLPRLNYSRSLTMPHQQQQLMHCPSSLMVSFVSSSRVSGVFSIAVTVLNYSVQDAEFVLLLLPSSSPLLKQAQANSLASAALPSDHAPAQDTDAGDGHISSHINSAPMNKLASPSVATPVVFSSLDAAADQTDHNNLSHSAAQSTTIQQKATVVQQGEHVISPSHGPPSGGTAGDDLNTTDLLPVPSPMPPSSSVKLASTAHRAISLESLSTAAADMESAAAPLFSRPFSSEDHGRMITIATAHRDKALAAEGTALASSSGSHAGDGASSSSVQSILSARTNSNNNIAANNNTTATVVDEESFVPFKCRLELGLIPALSSRRGILHFKALREGLLSISNLCVLNKFTHQYYRFESAPQVFSSRQVAVTLPVR